MCVPCERAPESASQQHYNAPHRLSCHSFSPAGHAHAALLAEQATHPLPHNSTITPLIAYAVTHLPLQDMPMLHSLLNKLRIPCLTTAL